MMKGVNFTFTATNKAAPAMASFQNGLRAVQQQTQAARVVNGGWMKSMDSNRRTIQQFGMQISDFAIQVGGGQSAMLAFVQQAPQMLQFFGAGGAAAAGFIAVFGTMALIMMKSGIAMSELTPILGVLEGDFKRIASVVIWLKDTFIDAINLIINNLDTVLIAAGGFAMYFGGAWMMSIIAGSGAVVALRGVLMATALSFYMGGAGAAAMTMATSILTGAMNLLRAALMRLGIPALIIAAAWLVTKFIALTNAGKSFGEAFHLVWNLVKSVFAGMTGYAVGFGHAIAGLTKSIVSKFVSAFAAIMVKWEQLVNNMIGAWNNFVSGAGLENLKMDEYVSSWAESAKKSAEDWATSADNSYGKASASFKNALGGIAAAYKAITDIIGTSDIDVRDWFGGAKEGSDGAAKELEKLAKQLEDVKKLFGETMGQFQALGPLGALGIAHLNDMWAKFVQDMKTTNNPAGVMDQFKAALGEAAQQAKQLYDAVKSPMEDMFMNIVDGTENVKDAFKKMASSVIKELFRILVVNQMVNSILGFFGIRNPATAVAMSTPSLPSFEGGGSTGYGARAGGLDGKGGFAAVLHPNETVVDHTQGGAAGVAITQNITFGSGVTRAEVQTMIPKIIEATKSAVLDARKRGGKFGGAFA